MQPSSPYLPCRALNTTSGPPPPAGRRKSISARRSRLTSYSTTSWPPSRRPSAQALPLTSETSRSGDQPPIRTATLLMRAPRGGGFPIPDGRRFSPTRVAALPRPAPRGRSRWQRRGEDPVGRRLAVAIAEAELGCGNAVNLAGTVDGFGRYENLRELSAIGAGIHRHRAADRARDAAQELQPGQRMLARRQRHVEIERARA